MDSVIWIIIMIVKSYTCHWIVIGEHLLQIKWCFCPRLKNIILSLLKQYIWRKINYVTRWCDTWGLFCNKVFSILNHSLLSVDEEFIWQSLRTFNTKYTWWNFTSIFLLSHGTIVKDNQHLLQMRKVWNQRMILRLLWFSRTGLSKKEFSKIILTWLAKHYTYCKT